MSEPLILDFNPDGGLATRAFETVDPIGAVIRAHKLVDTAVEHVLDFYEKVTGEARQSVREFGRKIDQLKKRKFPPVRVAALREFNSIRVDIAHMNLEEPTAVQIRKLQGAVGAIYGRKFKDNFVLTIVNKDGSVRAKKQFGEMTRAERYVLLATALQFAIAAFPVEFRAEYNKRAVAALGEFLQALAAQGHLQEPL